MSLVVRRRIAIGVVATSTALVAGFVVAPSAYAGNITSITQSSVFNNDPSETLTFHTENSFNPGSPVTLTRVGAAADTITGSVSTTSFDPTNPQATITKFQDGGAGTSDGPANPGQYSAKITQGSGPATGTSDFCTPPNCSFTVLPSEALSVTGGTPSLAQGDEGNVTVAGAGFARGSVISVLLPNGSVDPNVGANGVPTEPGDPLLDCFDPTADCNLEIDNRTTSSSLLRRFKVEAAAVVGTRGLRVTNTDGSSAQCAACFTVNGAPLQTVNPDVASNLPSSASPTVRITFFGSGLTSGTPSLVFVGDGTNPSAGSASRGSGELNIVGKNPSFAPAKDSVSADYDVRNAAPFMDGYQPVLTQANGTTNSCSCRFDIAQPSPPNVTSVDPKTVSQSDSRTVTINGTNFSKGVLINPGAGITVTKVTVLSATQVKAQIQVASNATAGDRDVSATSTDKRTGAICAKCLTVTASGSGSPSATPTSSTSPSASPQPSGCPATPVRVRVNTKTINATGKASVTVTGATSTATIELQGYSQDHFGRQNFDNDPTKIDRTGKADSNGSITFNDLRPPSNTRVRARQAGCSFGNSEVIEVRAQETLQVKRIGTRQYTFSGNSIPARPGGLIISLYRITGQACAAGVEPSKCPGEKFVGQNRASASTGRYGITITFPARDANTRDEFVVKTGRDAQNAPGRSNARSLAIF